MRLAGGVKLRPTKVGFGATPYESTNCRKLAEDGEDEHDQTKMLNSEYFDWKTRLLNVSISCIRSDRLASVNFLSILSVLPFDGKAAMEYGILRANLQKRKCLIGNMDMLIAAHAKSTNMTLVTNNTKEFKRVQGLTIEDWS